MSEHGVLGRLWRSVRGIVHQVRSGEDEMRAVYGDNPNHVSDEERIAGAAALNNLGNFGGGGTGF